MPDHCDGSPSQAAVESGITLTALLKSPLADGHPASVGLVVVGSFFPRGEDRGNRRCRLPDRWLLPGAGRWSVGLQRGAKGEPDPSAVAGVAFESPGGWQVPSRGRGGAVIHPTSI